MIDRLYSASDSTFTSLYPWLRLLTGIAILFHVSFWIYNQNTDASEPVLFRIAAILALLPFLLPFERASTHVQTLISRFTLLSFLIAAPSFLLASLLLELADQTPEVGIIVTRQYELLGAIAFYYLVCPDRLLATVLLALSSTLIFLAFYFTTDLDLSLLTSTSGSLLSAYWIIAFTALIVVLRKDQEIKSKSVTLGTVGTSIAHELRTPLLSIRARAEALNQTSAGDQTVHALAIIDEVDSANTLIDMFLIKANPTTKEVQTKRFKISDAIHEAVERYPYKSAKHRSCISVTNKGDGDLEGPYELFLHVVFNLLKNAFEHLDVRKGHVAISIERTSHHRITIEDNGRGIDRDNLAQVFTPFFSTSANYGAGVGLAFCRAVIKDHFHGEVNLESQKGAYTRVVIEIPVDMS